jgi:hypothetical protein
MTIDASHQKPLTYVKAVCRPGRTIAHFPLAHACERRIHERKVCECAVKIVAVFSWRYHRRHIGCGQSSWSSLRLTSFDEGMGETHGGAWRDHTFHHLQVCEAHPNQAVPLEGSWFGDAKDYLGMSVSVTVNKIGEIADPSEG